MIRLLARALALVLFATFLLPLLTLAAVAATIEIDVPAFVGLIAEPLLGVVSALALVFITWLAELVRRKLNLEIEARHREAFQTALVNGAGHLLADLKARSGKVTIETQSDLLAAAANNVLRSVPDAARKFGLDRATVERKILDKLAAIAPAEAVAAPIDLGPPAPTER